MVFKHEQNPLQENIEILLTYPKENKTVQTIISFINSLDDKIDCYLEGRLKQISVSDIYYIESMDKIAVVYCEKDSYKTKYRLYQIYEELAAKGFIQISKYCIFNINKFDSIRPLFNSRMEITLTNGKHLYVNRNYIDGIEKKLMENE